MTELDLAAFARLVLREYFDNRPYNFNTNDIGNMGCATGLLCYRKPNGEIGDDTGPDETIELSDAARAMPAWPSAISGRQPLRRPRPKRIRVGANKKQATAPK